jgi:hypothetical protein
MIFARSFENKKNGTKKNARDGIAQIDHRRRCDAFSLCRWRD